MDAAPNFYTTAVSFQIYLIESDINLIQYFDHNILGRYHYIL